MTFLSSLNRADLDEKQPWPHVGSPGWPQVCCKNMIWKQTEGSSNSLYCWFLHLLLKTTHTGDFKATPTPTPNTLSNHWPVSTSSIHSTYGHSQHSNRTRYRTLKRKPWKHSVKTRLPRVFTSHSLVLHCLKMRSVSVQHHSHSV